MTRKLYIQGDTIEVANNAITIAEYAKANFVHANTARAFLEAMVKDGKATRSTIEFAPQGARQYPLRTAPIYTFNA